MEIFSSLLTRVKFALLSGEAESSVEKVFSKVVLNPEIRKKLRRISEVVVFVFITLIFMKQN
jgi:hypothetical protein